MKVQCDLLLFKFGLETVWTESRYYTSTQNSLISRGKRYVTTAVPLAAWITQAVALLYCHDKDLSIFEHTPYWLMYNVRTLECLRARDDSGDDLAGVFAQLGSTIESKEEAVRLMVKRMEYTAAETSGLCLSAIALTILINITLTIMLYYTCKDIRYTRQRYRKLQ